MNEWVLFWGQLHHFGWDMANSIFDLQIISRQGHGQGQACHRSHLRPGVPSICLLFVSGQSFHFWLRYGKFHIWPWKFKVKVMVKAKPSSHIWGLELNPYVCFWFHSNCTIFSKFHNWPWNFKVNVMGEVKGQGVGLACHWCTYFSFLVNRANHSKDMVKWVFDPKKHIRNFGEKKIGKKSFHQNFSKI